MRTFNVVRVILLASMTLLTHAALAEKAAPSVHAPIDGKDLKFLSRSPNVVVGGYRVLFVVRNGVKATASSDVSSETIVNLAGVDGDLLQTIANEAYADLLARIPATGRNLIDLRTVKTTKGFGKLETTASSSAQPYCKKPFADSRSFAVYSAGPLPLWWGHFDAPIGDKGAMALANWKAINQLSVDTKAVVIVPQVAVDFATLKSSGRSVFAGNASTEAKASLRLLENQTLLRVFHAKIAMAGDLGAGILKKPIPLADSAGKLVSLRDWGNQDEVAFANSLMTNPAVGNVGPGYSYSGQELAYVVDPAAFKEAVMEGIRQYNAMVASALQTYQ